MMREEKGRGSGCKLNGLERRSGLMNDSWVEWGKWVWLGWMNERMDG